MKKQVLLPVIFSLFIYLFSLAFTGCDNGDTGTNSPSSTPNNHSNPGNPNTPNNPVTPGTPDDDENPNVIFETTSYGIAVQDGNVYVVGNYYDVFNSENDTACYWVNGTRVDLPLPDNVTLGKTTGIAVQGGNVYVSGRYSLYSMMYNNRRSCYWVNGKPAPGLYLNSLNRGY